MRVLRAFLLVLSLPAAAWAGGGSLHVTSFPAGAAVSVDGVPLGKVTPLSVALDAGEHQVRLEIPGTEWQPWAGTVSIGPGRNELHAILVPALTVGPSGPPGPPGPPGPVGPPGAPGPVAGAQELALAGVMGLENHHPLPFNPARPADCSEGGGMTFLLAGAEIGEVIGLLGADGLSTTFAYRVALRVPGALPSPADGVGQPGVLRLQRGAQVTTFGGVVTQFSLAAFADGHSAYVVRLEPPLATLRYHSGYRIHQDRGVEDIVAAELGDAGIAAFAFDLERTYDPIPFEMRYDDTPLRYLDHLLEREGIHYHFLDDGSPVFSDHNGSFAADPVELAYHGHLVDPPAPGPSVHTFHRGRGMFTGTRTVAGYDPERPLVDILGSAVAPGGIGESFLFSSAVTRQDVASLRAQTRSDADLSGREEVFGTSDSERIRAGRRLALTDASGAGFDGSYIIVSARHFAWPHPPDGTGGCFRYGNWFRAVPSSVPYRPQRRTPPPRAPGLATAVVTGPPGSEVFTDDLGRIKVRFHWDRQGPSDETSSAWIRVLAPAGRTGGQERFIPEVGDEVLVGFLEGDPSVPVVLGNLWNGEDRPPQSLLPRSPTTEPKRKGE